MPFLDPVNNASEWTSRLNYLSTSATAFAITLDIPGKEILDSYVLYRYAVGYFLLEPPDLISLYLSIYIITYGLGFCPFYFTSSLSSIDYEPQIFPSSVLTGRRKLSNVGILAYSDFVVTHSSRLI